MGRLALPGISVNRFHKRFDAIALQKDGKGAAEWDCPQAVLPANPLRLGCASGFLSQAGYDTI
jgi:hypothetical protein